MSKKAFTLAEVMIVLTILGVLAGILVPIGIQSTPDKNIMKFKKADTTFKNAIRELINSDKYFSDSLFIHKSDGSRIKNYDYFCKAFADIVSTKSVNCDYIGQYNSGVYWFGRWVSGSNFVEEDLTFSKTTLDNACSTLESSISGTVDIGIKTTDGILYFEENPQNYFGCYQGNADNKCLYQAYNEDIPFIGGPKDYVQFINGVKTYRFYKIFCIDVDGINKGEAPFGYGVRADGKIMTGARADEWLSKSIQRKQED